jgi:hypothetical protein
LDNMGKKVELTSANFGLQLRFITSTIFMPFYKLIFKFQEVEEIKALRMYRKASEAQTIAKEKTEQEELRYKNKFTKSLKPSPNP